MQGVRCQSSAVVAPDFCCCTWKKLVESLTAALRLIWHAPSWCWRSISKQWVWCNWPKAMCYVSWSFEAWRPCMPFLWRVSLLTPRLGCTWAMVGCETRVVASKISTRSTHDLSTTQNRAGACRLQREGPCRHADKAGLTWCGVHGCVSIYAVCHSMFTELNGPFRQQHYYILLHYRPI